MGKVQLKYDIYNILQMSAENTGGDRTVSKWHNFCHDSNMLCNVLYKFVAAITPNICFCMM